MGAIKVLLKRATRRKMGIGDLLSVGGSLIAKPPEFHGWAKTLSERKYSTGQTLLDGWREEIKGYLSQIAGEPTWELQKLRLLKIYLSMARWNGVYKAISGGNERSIVWHEWVRDLTDFKNLPSEEWLFRLTILHMYAAYNGAVLAIVGIGCYGLSAETRRLVHAYQEMEVEGHRNNILVNEALQALADQDEDLHRRVYRDHADELAQVMRESNYLMRALSESIATERVDTTAIGNRWRDMANQQNDVLLKIKAAITHRSQT